MIANPTPEAREPITSTIASIVRLIGQVAVFALAIAALRASCRYVPDGDPDIHIECGSRRLVTIYGAGKP